MKILTAAEMRECDRITTEKYGVPSLTLMENAGSAVAEYVLEKYPNAKTVGVLCGKGNNGGDGFVAARKLHEAGKQVRVLLLADPAELKGDAAEMYKRMPFKASSAVDDAEFEAQADIYQSDLLIDAIAGTGFKPPLSGIYRAAITATWDSFKPVVSIDLPSGLPADDTTDGFSRHDHVRANDVVSFTSAKTALVSTIELARVPIVIVDIGSPSEAVVSSLGLNVTTGRISLLRGHRDADSNKGSFGHVLTIGGSLGKSGAAAMAGMAALRSGAGLSTVACPRSVLEPVAAFAPELMTEPLPETDDGSISLRGIESGRIYAVAQGKTVLAIGPGVTRHPQAAEFVRMLVHKAQHPIVLDADGLNAFEGRADELQGDGRTLVITPHPGEMARLTGLGVEEIQHDRVKVARSFAKLHGCIVVLKGWRTVIAKPDGEVWINTTGNPGMATGGTGDVLTGTIAGLIAQHPARAFEAVVAAVYLHGLAGDLARDELGECGMITTDVLHRIPKAFLEVEKRAQEKFVRVN